ncbi:MAG: thiamine phosphate synthase [Planctomycetota bacterium]
MERQLERAVRRILDANLNRAAEGLRTAEEYARFALGRGGLYHELRAVRHAALAVFTPRERDIFMRERDSVRDPGARTDERAARRATAGDAALAGMRRATEALRVIEENLKIADARRAVLFKALRYRAYTAEKGFSLPLARLASARLAVVITGHRCRRHYDDTVRMAVDGGADMIMLSEPDLGDRAFLTRARCAMHVADDANALVVICRRADIARLADAHGVLVGPADLPTVEIKALMPGAIAGLFVSIPAHGTVQGAAFTSVGPVYAVEGDTEIIGLKGLAAILKGLDRQQPAFVFGGITPANAPMVLKKGARCLAVGRAVTGAANPLKETRRFRQLLDRTR